jgi:hypothetical protein
VGAPVRGFLVEEEVPKLETRNYRLVSALDVPQATSSPTISAFVSGKVAVKRKPAGLIRAEFEHDRLARFDALGDAILVDGEAVGMSTVEKVTRTRSSCCTSMRAGLNATCGPYD